MLFMFVSSLYRLSENTSFSLKNFKVFGFTDDFGLMSSISYEESRQEEVINQLQNDLSPEKAGQSKEVGLSTKSAQPSKGYKTKWENSVKITLPDKQPHGLIIYSMDRLNICPFLRRPNSKLKPFFYRRNW
jgi:hypothetical protein